MQVRLDSDLKKINTLFSGWKMGITMTVKDCNGVLCFSSIIVSSKIISIDLLYAREKNRNK